MEFESEWRVFVYNGVIQAVKQYAGCWYNMLSSHECKTIENIVREAFSAGLDMKACTIDIGKTTLGNLEVIEVHNFVSCGLYGFEDSPQIAAMVKAGWEYEINS